MATSRQAHRAVRSRRRPSAAAARRQRAVRVRALRRAAIVVIGVVIVAALIVLAYVVPPDAWSRVNVLIAFARQWSTTPFAPLVALVVFVLGGLIGFPVNLCIAASVLVFGPILGGAYALVGSLASAAVLGEIGRLIPPDVVERRLSARGQRVRRAIDAHGLLAVALVRLLPIAPYSVVSLVAGAVRVPRVRYLAGTAIGMLPGVVLYAVFADRALALLAAPGPLAWISLAVSLLAIVGVAWLLNRNAPVPAKTRR